MTEENGPSTHLSLGALSPSSVCSSKSPSSQDDDGFSIYTSLDGGNTAAVMMHRSKLDAEDLPDGSLLVEVGSFSVPESLESLLRGSLVTYGGPGSGSQLKWLPVDRLFQHVNLSQVYHELRGALESKIRSGEFSTSKIVTWSQKICQQHEYTAGTEKKGVFSSQKIFAILTLMGQVQDAPAFIDAGLTDMHLPLCYERSVDSCDFYSSSNCINKTPLPLQWQAKCFDLFDQYQVYMLSPFFELERNEVPFYELHAKSVLPFIEDGSKQRPQSGLHGTVYRVKIHPAHHNSQGVSPVLFFFWYSLVI